MIKYNVTKLFTSGILAGLEIVDHTSIRYTVGERVSAYGGGSGYIVTAVEEVEEVQPAAVH